MNTKIIKDPNECPSCNLPRGLCRCTKGGGAVDEEKSKDEDRDEVERQREQRIVTKPVVAEGTSGYRTLLNESNQLLCCTLFASAEQDKQPAPELSDESHEANEENASNAESTSFSMGMRMGGSGE